MKNHKQWKHKKEFDTKTLFEDIRKDEKILNENSESSGGKSDISNKENSERLCVQSPSDTIPKNTRIHISSEEKNVSGNGGHPAKKTKVYEPRPLTPDDEIYEDILEHFASAPTKPKYWFEEFGDYWSCSCGHINKGNSCKNCGLDRELLRSLFILHKPADTPGKLNKKLRKAKEQVDREETLEAERKRRHRNLMRRNLQSLILLPVPKRKEHQRSIHIPLRGKMMILRKRMKQQIPIKRVTRDCRQIKRKILCSTTRIKVHPNIRRQTDKHRIRLLIQH